MSVIQTQQIQTDINAAVTADVDAAVAAATGLILMGWSVRESAGTPAIANGKLVNGATGSAAGKVGEIGLVASDSKTVWLGPNGIPCPLGISIDHLAGQFDIVLFYRVQP